MKKKVVLDLFCGAGGASKGYVDAGFDVVGVDIAPQRNYPFNFVQKDAIKELDHLVWLKNKGWKIIFDLIHASPPCQRYSKMAACRPGLQEKYPDLIEEVRSRLKFIGIPYIIENVPQAPLENPVNLCGSQFNRYAEWPGWGKVVLRRHRHFESSLDLRESDVPHDHKTYAVTVAGHSPKKSGNNRHGTGYVAVAREIMGTEWMTREEMAESVPPCYTEFLGRQCIDML